MSEYAEFRTLYLPDLLNYVVPVLQCKKEIELGSGMLVKVGGRHLIATAKHCIDAEKVRALRSNNPLQLQREGFSGTHELRILGKGWHDTLDLGYLEIEDPACPELGWAHLCTETIKGGLVHFIGYPEVLTKPVKMNSGAVTDISIAAGTFSTTMIEQTNECMTFDFPEMGSRYDPATATWHESPFPKHRRGFSGGACYGVAKPEGSILRVEYKLLGIQFA